MSKSVQRAVVFAVAVFLLLLLADAFFVDVFRGGFTAEHRDAVQLVHMVFPGAVLVFSGLGAWVGFLLAHAPLPSMTRSFATGAAFGLISVVAISGILRAFGIDGVIGWLFFGAVVATLASRLLSPLRHAKPTTPVTPTHT